MYNHSKVSSYCNCASVAIVWSVTTITGLNWTVKTSRIGNNFPAHVQLAGMLICRSCFCGSCVLFPRYRVQRYLFASVEDIKMVDEADDPWRTAAVSTVHLPACIAVRCSPCPPATPARAPFTLCPFVP